MVNDRSDGMHRSPWPGVEPKDSSPELPKVGHLYHFSASKVVAGMTQRFDAMIQIVERLDGKNYPAFKAMIAQQLRIGDPNSLVIDSLSYHGVAPLGGPVTQMAAQAPDIPTPKPEGGS